MSNNTIVLPEGKMVNNTIIEWHELQKKQVCVTKRLTEVSQDLEVELCLEYPQYRVLKQLMERLYSSRLNTRGTKYDFEWSNAFSTAIGIVQDQMNKCKKEILEAEMAMINNEP